MKDDRRNALSIMNIEAKVLNMIELDYKFDVFIEKKTKKTEKEMLS